MYVAQVLIEVTTKSITLQTETSFDLMATWIFLNEIILAK